MLVGFLRPPMPPSPDATILNYLNDSERGGGGGAPLSFVGFWRRPNAPHPPTPQYLTILMTERGAPLSFVGFWRPLPSPDATILNDLNDRERGRQYPVRS